MGNKSLLLGTAVSFFALLSAAACRSSDASKDQAVKPEIAATALPTAPKAGPNGQAFPKEFFESDAVQNTPSVPLIAPDKLRAFYPTTEPRQKGFLEVGTGDKIYYEVSGNPKGKSIIFIHGGPGWHSQPKNRGWFDPALYNIVLFDQRGSGLSSLSAGDLTVSPSHFERLTIQSQVEDIEALRKFLKIDKWVVFGGSWGSTLSLAYAEAHPETLAGLILRGIYLGTQFEHHAIYYGNMPTKHPVAWKILSERVSKSPLLTPTQQKLSLLPGYRELVMKDDRISMGIWALYEEYITTPSEAPELLKNMQTLAGKPTAQDIDDIIDGDRRTTAIMQTSMFTDLEAKRWLLDPVKLGKIKVPVTIVQGANDPICPPRFADGLAATMKAAGVRLDYKKVPTGQHEPDHNDQMRTWLLRATELYAKP